MQQIFSLICVLVVFCTSCTVSLRNNYIDYTTVKTFSVEQFETNAPNAPPTVGQQFSERLKIKVLSDTRLKFLSALGDISFSGAVSKYEISAVAPQANETTSFQRLSIEVTVLYKNAQEKDKTKSSWRQQFRRFANFPADADLSSVEDQLIREIYDQVLEDVFNKAFTGW